MISFSKILNNGFPGDLLSKGFATSRLDEKNEKSMLLSTDTHALTLDFLTVRNFGDSYDAVIQKLKDNPSEILYFIDTNYDTPFECVGVAWIGNKLEYVCNGKLAICCAIPVVRILKSNPMIIEFHEM
jgi:hypothetical protein